MALGNEVTEVSDGPILANSASTKGSVPVETNGHSGMLPPDERSQPNEEAQFSKEDPVPLKLQKSGANPSLDELQHILDQIEDWEDRLENLKDYTSKRKSRLKKRLARSGSRSSSSGTSHSSDTSRFSSKSRSSSKTRQEPEERISIPQLNFVSWSTMVEHGYEIVPPSHYAIDILNSKPITSQAMGSPRPNRMQFTNSPNEESKGSNLNPPKSDAEENELPERIRINSRRLISVLDFDICDRRLRWEPTWPSPFIILGPFKILVYLDARIRNRLKEFERARLKLKSASEEEYLEELEMTPVFDNLVAIRQDESLMSLSELTATINDLRCLTKFMDEILIPAQIRLRENPGQVQFSDLWYVFPQGSLVTVKGKNNLQRVWKVVQRTGGRRYLSRPDHIPHGEFADKFSPFVLDCYNLDYDAVRYMASHKRFQIDPFDGTQPLSSLPMYPFSVVEQERPSYREELLARGRQFMECTKVRHCHYSGRTQIRTSRGNKLSDYFLYDSEKVTVFSERVDSEVIVDFERAFQEVPSWRPSDDDIEVHAIDTNEIAGDYFLCTDKDSIWDDRLARDFMDAEAQKRDEWEKSGTGPSQDDDILLLPDRVFAFVLRTRKWGKHGSPTIFMNIVLMISSACLLIGKDTDKRERLTPVEATPEPWNNLELPKGHKEIVQSLIESHFSRNKSHVHWDLVKDKGKTSSRSCSDSADLYLGKGVVILLHGVPGVGKTSTAGRYLRSRSVSLEGLTQIQNVRR